MEFHTICVMNEDLKLKLFSVPPAGRLAGMWAAQFCLSWPLCRKREGRSTGSLASGGQKGNLENQTSEDYEGLEIQRSSCTGTSDEN